MQKNATDNNTAPLKQAMNSSAHKQDKTEAEY
jgi:hypothetical protein